MMYLIDSDILIYLGRGNTLVQERISQAGLTNCVISEISLAELYVGAYKSKAGRLESILEYMEKTFPIAAVSPALKRYARLRAALELKGTRLEDMDMMIAATALEHGYTLVTHNVRHYARIPDLKLEDWMAET
jgi:tRNA(fMet)-specific endonuclease VapC